MPGKNWVHLAALAYFEQIFFQICSASVQNPCLPGGSSLLVRLTKALLYQLSYVGVQDRKTAGPTKPGPSTMLLLLTEAATECKRMPNWKLVSIRHGSFLSCGHEIQSLSLV
jgi:hypothetical protein